MDEFSTGREIASAMGDLLRSFRDAGYELRRLPELSEVPTVRDCFDQLVTDNQLAETSRTLFQDHHYARAVEEAFKCLNNAVKAKSGVVQHDGAALMRTAFSARSPILAFNDLQSRSEQDEQQGYMDIFAGSMTGIRNPRAHQHDLSDEPEIALELIVLANHLMRKLQSATKR